MTRYETINMLFAHFCENLIDSSVACVRIFLFVSLAQVSLADFLDDAAV